MSLNSVLNPICRGLVGYISYLATCRNSTIYSEYLLYEPLLRIAQAQDCKVSCEVPVRSMHRGRGDHKRIDFVLRKGDERIGLEVKWVKPNRIVDIQTDVNKLIQYNKETKALGYVIIFGPTKAIELIKFKKNTPQSKSNGEIVNWLSGKTSYGARWFRYV